MLTSLEDTNKMENHVLELLKNAQNGDKNAEEMLIAHIRDNIMRRRIGRYLHRNRQVEDEDLIQEFLIGVAFAIPKANLDIGDPVEYIIQQGIYRVRTYLRKHIIQGTSQVCMDCGYESRLNKVDGHYECKKCKSHNIITRETSDHDETLFLSIESVSSELDDILTSMLIQEFEKTLDHSTNVYRLYELMVVKGINRDNPNIKNYIKTISAMWGGCSQQNVLQNMYKLQAKFVKFLNDNNIMIKDGRLVEKWEDRHE